MLLEHIVSKIMSYVSHTVADIFSSKFDEWEYTRCAECAECRRGGEGPCTCPMFHASEIESLYLVSEPSYKLEKILELKVVMNYLETQMGLYSYGKLLSNQNQRIEYIARKFPEIQQYHPMFYHCNKDLIKTCLVMIIRNAKLDLNNYEELYDQLSQIIIHIFFNMDLVLISI